MFEHWQSENFPRWGLVEWRNLEYESEKNRYDSTSKCKNVYRTAGDTKIHSSFCVLCMNTLSINNIILKEMAGGVLKNFHARECYIINISETWLSN